MRAWVHSCAVNGCIAMKEEGMELHIDSHACDPSHHDVTASGEDGGVSACRPLLRYTVA
jgi:hypothetical protein